MLAGTGAGDIRDLAIGAAKERRPATSMVGRLIAAMRGGF
jgi:hypothetical protein